MREIIVDIKREKLPPSKIGPYVQPGDHIVTPGCCEKAVETGAVYLHVDIYDEPKNQKPEWHVNTYYPRYRCQDSEKADFCPFCATVP